MDDTDSPRRVLILTNSELGAANVALATIHELMQLEPNLEIHLVSFDSMVGSYKSALEFAIAAAPHARRPTFHQLEGPNLSQAIAARDPEYWETISHRLNLNPFRIAVVARAIAIIQQAWDVKDFVNIYRQLETIVADVRPHLTVLDPCFAPGWALCHREKLQHIILQPNSIKDLALGAQPRGQALWKYPALSSGFSFPVPWHRIPLNIFYSLVFGICLITDSRHHQITKEIEKELGFKPSTFHDIILEPPSVPILLGCRPEVDFPMTVTPEFIVPCGPIIRPGPLIGRADPELEKWLARGRNLYINMGSLKKYAEAEALEMAMGVRMLLDEAGRVSHSEDLPLQVLWKLKREDDYGTKEGSPLHSILRREMDQDKVRIVDWLDPEPSTVLESGYVICSVNHGGASSWYEALCAGVPQVLLPVWADTYDAPHRARFLGVGRWGNPKSAPQCSASELGPALIEVVLGPEAAQMRARAKELATLCTSGGHGRTKAAMEILNRAGVSV